MRTFLARPKLGQLDVFELDAKLFEDGGAAGDDGDVFEHGLAAIAKAGGLDGGDFEGAAELVDHQSCQASPSTSSAMMSTGLPDSAALLRAGTNVAGAADFLFVDQDVDIIQDGFLAWWFGDEVRAEVTLVELHAFDEFNGGVEAFAFFDGDDAVFADLFHGVGDHLADLGVLVGRGWCRPAPPGRNFRSSSTSFSARR